MTDVGSKTRPWLTRNVLWLGVVSLLTDASSEMIVLFFEAAGTKARFSALLICVARLAQMFTRRYKLSTSGKSSSG